jgi:copper homeostasis protein
MTANLFSALDDLLSVGVDRVLTSGGDTSALLGRDVIRKLVQNAQGRVGIIAGAGIKPENVRMLVQETGVKEVHVGLRSSLPSPMIYRNTKISMGSAQDREYQRFVVLEGDVRRLREALAAGPL